MFADSQWDVVGHSLGFDEIFWLVLGNDVPTNSIIDAVLEKHGPVDCIRLVQGSITAVCLRHTAYLQHEHDLTGEERCVEGDQLY